MKVGFHGATTMTADLQTDAARLLPGLGVVPLDEICGCLKGIGYDGPCPSNCSARSIGLGPIHFKYDLLPVKEAA